MVSDPGDASSKAKAIGLGGKIVGSIFLGFFVMMGTSFTVMFGGTLWKNIPTLRWETTPCTVISSRVAEQGDGANRYALDITYRYAYRGKTYTSDSYQQDYRGSDRYSEVAVLASAYQKGTQATCYVNPSNPTEAILERKTSWLFALPFMLIPLLFVAFGVGGIYLIWRGKKKPVRPDGTEAASPISEAPKFRATRLLIPFLGIFCVIGAVTFFFFFLRPMIRSINAARWEKTPCTILHSGITSQTSSGRNRSTTYSLDILYEYTYKGRRYTSNRYGFLSGSSSSRGWREEVVRRLSPGTKSACLVNPSNPSEAVLSRSLGPDAWFGLIPLIFVLIGAGGIVAVVKHRKTKTTATGTAQTTKLAAPTERVPITHELTLRPKATPHGKLIGFVIMALFWNGIISVFIHSIASGWQRGSAPWFQTLFLVPFVLIGLGLIGGVFYQFLALFNPRPTLRVRPGEVPLGGTLGIHWQMAGNATRIQRLIITLEGREQATYRRGTNTHTDRNTFAVIPVSETTNPQDMHLGSAEVVIPSDTMHTFRAPNNKILWQIKVHGDIHRWPDLNQEYEITILPMEPERKPYGHEELPGEESYGRG